MARDELVPSWELDGRYGAEPPPEQGGGGGSRLDGILTAIAVIAILALGRCRGPVPARAAEQGRGAQDPAAIVRVPRRPADGRCRPPSPASRRFARRSVAATAAPTAPASVGPSAVRGSTRSRPVTRWRASPTSSTSPSQDILDANPEITRPEQHLRRPDHRHPTFATHANSGACLGSVSVPRSARLRRGLARRRG